MDGVEGVGNPSWSARFSANQAKKPAEAAPSSHCVEAYESGAGMDGPLEMSRAFLSENLTSSGFMDIRNGVFSGLRAFVERALSKPEPVEVELDPLTASEIATHMGSELTGDINLVLRILAQVHPEHVAMLLR